MEENESKELYGWGKNQYGVLGKSMAMDEDDPEIIPQPTKIILKSGKRYIPLQVSCGKNHSVVLATNDTGKMFKAGVEYEKTSREREVFTFGDPSNGKLGTRKEKGSPEDEEETNFLLKPMAKSKSNPSMDFTVSNIVKFPSGNAQIQMISCGSTFTLALDINGVVFSWGEGSTGALGTGMFRDELSPAKVALQTKVKFISSGYFHAAAISAKGQLYTWGIGSEGQLGHKSNLNINVPRKLDFFEEAAYVSCGMFHTGCIDEKGFLFTWGGNKNGQLGHGDYEDRNYPAMVKFFKNFCVNYVNCGPNSTFVITEEGKVFSFGSNLHGKLAGTDFFEADILQSNTFSSPIESQLSINRISAEILENNENCQIYAIATSNQFCMALTNKGHLLTWGNNNNGCLGRFDEEEEIDSDPKPACIGNMTFRTTKKEAGTDITVSTHFVDVKAGLFHSVGLTNAGEVYVWGSNEYSQHGITANRLNENANKLQENIKYTLDYFNVTMLPSLVETFDIKQNKKVSHIACGYEYVFAIQNNKIVYSWGRNTHGQCGIGSVSNKVEEPHMISFFDSHVLKEVVCGERHTLILDDKGDVYACGDSYGGKLGLGSMSTVQTSPKQINLKGVISIACGPNHSMALVKEMKKENLVKTVLYTWGNGWNGELGHGNKDNVYNPKYIETKYNFIAISCGSHHSAGITDDNKLVVWGPCKYLGMNIPEDQPLEKAYFTVPTLHPYCIQNENFKLSQVILGDKYNLAISLQKEVFYWGVFDIIYNNIIKSSAEATYMKNLKNPSRLDTDLKFDCVTVSSNHALGIVYKFNRLYSWGIDGNTGRLGLGYEFIDDELEEDNKKNQKQKYVGITAYDQTLHSPVMLHFLYFLLNRLSKETLKKQNIQNQQAASDRPALHMHKNSSNSNPKISSFKILGGSFAQNTTEKKSQMEIRRNPSQVFEKSSKYSSFMEVGDGIPGNKYDLYNNCQSTEQEENLLNYQYTQNLFHENQLKYSEIRTEFQNILVQIQNRKKLKKRIIGIILKRISSYPFEANFLTKEKKNEKIQKWPQFFLNKKKFQAIFTILQLHPCYFLKIYKTDKLSPDSFFNLVTETYGDLENDNRKLALYINLCQMILKHDVEKYEQNLNANEDMEIELTLDPNSRFYTFVKLFIHLFNSSISNKKWLKFCLKKILETIDKEIYENEQSSKMFKQYAIVFRDIIQVSSDIDKKKFYGEKVARLVKMMQTVISELSSSKQSSFLEISKHVKRLADKIKSIFLIKKNSFPNLTEEEIKKKILSN